MRNHILGMVVDEILKVKGNNFRNYPKSALNICKPRKYLQQIHILPYDLLFVQMFWREYG
jgi:hypothetical protein